MLAVGLNGALGTGQPARQTFIRHGFARIDTHQMREGRDQRRGVSSFSPNRVEAAIVPPFRKEREKGEHPAAAIFGKDWQS